MRFYALPENGDQVLVAFEQRQPRPALRPRQPVAREGAPAGERNADGTNTRRIIKTQGGHTITFDDSTQGKSLTLRTRRGARSSRTP